MANDAIGAMLDNIIRREGGFTNDPADSGGARAVAQLIFTRTFFQSIV